MKYKDARILIFCKAPVLGQVKTRLVPMLGEKQALLLYQELTTRMISTCLESELAPVQIWTTEDHAFFHTFGELGKVGHIRIQQGDNLGQRMQFALTTALLESGVQRAILAGTDCPPVDMSYLDKALAALEDHDAVLGPTEDGGYGLIGLWKVQADYFSDIPWSTDSVCADTCSRFNRNGLHWSLLPQIWDVDRPEDIMRYQKFCQTLPRR